MIQVALTRSRAGQLTALALMGLLTSTESCSKGALDPHGPPAIQILSGANVIDTIYAQPAPMIVRIRGAGSGVPVRVSGVPGSGGQSISVARIGAPFFEDSYTDTTDSKSQIAIRVWLGTTAETQLVRIEVPKFGLDESVPFVVRHGAPVRLEVGPNNVTLVVGQETAIGSVTVMDQFGNRSLPDRPVTLLSLDPAVTISGTTIRAVQTGVARVNVSLGAVVTQIFLSVVPDATLSALLDGLQIFRTNGSTRDRIPIAVPYYPAGSDWTPDGQHLVADWGAELHVIDLDGKVRTLQLATDPQESPSFSPRVTADGAWVYYAQRAMATVWEVRRVHLDGSGDEFVVSSGHTSGLPSPSPDGTRIAYVRDDGVCIFDFVTGTSNLLVPRGTQPAWSPDGSLIAYNDGVVFNLEVIRPDGTGQRRLSFAPPTQIHWSPDNKWLLLGFDFYDVATGARIPLTLPGLFGVSAWKPR